MFSNPITSIFGALSIVSVILKHLKPQWAAVLDEIMGIAIGSGLIASADAGKVKSTAFRSVLWLIGFTLIVSALVSPVSAQTVVVDLNKASLAWEWAKGQPPNDGDPESFLAKCGKVQGVYNVQTPISDPTARTVSLRSILNGQGKWFCVVAATNRYGQSGNSNEVSFDAGAVPADPTGAKVQAQ